MKYRSIIFFAVLFISTAFGLPKLVLPEPETGPLTLSFSQGYNFDPLKQEPNFPEPLKISAYDGKWGYYIIQFPGPIQKKWQRNITRIGSSFLDYINRYAYLVRLPNAKLEVINELPEVRWLGLYQPAYKIFPYLEKTPGSKSLIVVFFYDCNENEVLRKLQNLGAANIVTEFNWINKSVKIDIDGTKIEEIANIPEVYWIEYYFPITPDNVDVQWVDQKGYSGVADTSRPIWRKGIMGDGIIVSITDSPLWMGHDLYRDLAVPNPGPTHRKVIAYTGTVGSSSHGTHTTGTLCGDDSAVGGTSLNDGLAKHARVYFQNSAQFTGWDMNTWLIGPYNGVGNLKARNHSMSLSRKDSFSDYVWTDRSFDQFLWTHRDFMHCNSMGNYNLAPTMGHPPVAKNLISVGSCENGAGCQTLSTFTSIGPTNDGRRKPTLVSPGGNIYSAGTASASSYISSSGTSMSTPNMTAATALIRQYFREGWYPSGTKNLADSIWPSAALIKTAAIVGADNSINYAVPSNYVGWGRLNLDSSLYFAGDNKKLWILDDTIGLNTNDSVIYQIQIDNSTQPFRVSLVWSDYPGTPYSFPILVNNLDLTVTSPTGLEYKGSVYSSGQSVTGGNYDTLNVEECTRINTPLTGIWKIKVKAKNVPFGPQPFALAATYGISAQFHDVGVVAISSPVGPLDSAQITVPACTVYNYGNFTENYSVRMKIGALYNRTASISTHLPGTKQYITFPACTVYQRGNNALACSTELVGDVQSINDKQIGSVFVRVLDVGTSALLSPPAIIDSGQTIAPQARLKNLGNVAANNITVRFTINSWQDDTTITVLLPNESTLVTFANWTALPRGNLVTGCSTRLTGDMQNANDKQSGSIFVQVFDVGTTELVAPSGTVDSGSVLTPQVKIKNHGNSIVNFNALFTIDSYSSTKPVNNLTPNEERTIDFDNWTALTRGILVTKCTTQLAGDMQKNNDKITSSVLVRVLDVGTSTIISPPAIVDSGQTISPQAMVKNFGNATANNIPVRFNIGSWEDDTTITSLAANESTVVTFASWTANQRGGFATQCSTRLSGDLNPFNDKQTGSVSIRVKDIGIASITLPDTINFGATVTPICSLYNYGSTIETYQVVMKVNGVFTEMLPVSTHAPGTYANVIFIPLNLPPGDYVCSCSLAMSDMNSVNDTMSEPLFVQSLDVGVTKIIAPTGTISLGTVITPACSVYNYGNTPVIYSARMTIGGFYNEDTLVVNQTPGAYQSITFPAWTVNQIGTYNVTCSTELVGDMNTSNDEKFDSVIVTPISQAGWIRMTETPAGSSGKNPKSGSSMAGLDVTGKIYFLKASNTQDFCIYTPDAGIGTWTSETIPLGTKEAGDGKKPKKGASMAGFDNTVYVLRGNNTPGFWEYKTTPTESSGWYKLLNIPTGAKNPKDASGLVAVNIGGTDYIFAMKGSKTDEFYLYDIANNTWTPTPTKPSTGASTKVGYKKGSCLCYDGVNSVYVLKGTYGDFFSYNLTTNTWTKLKRYDYKLFINRDGKKKKIGEGSGLVYYNNKIYLLKGGNTLGFWLYDIASDSFMQMGPAADWDIPTGGGKKVKGGGALTLLGNDFYATKGSNTPEFYKHSPPSIAIAPTANQQLGTEGALGNKLITEEFKLTIVPNPAINGAVVRYSLPKAGQVVLKLYNVTGNLIKTYTNSNPSKDGLILIDTKKIPSGVYILRFSSGDLKVTRKLVIDK